MKKAMAQNLIQFPAIFHYHCEPKKIQEAVHLSALSTFHDP
jgi:hypothetical protein